jgi:hypothetical protein
MGIPLKVFLSWKGNKAPIPQKYQRFNAKGDKAKETLEELFEYKRFQAKAVAKTPRSKLG